MKECDYVRVDVFTRRPFGGNPLAVFLDAEGLGAKDMQRLAREMNLSETTFVLPPTDRSKADARVRIFTPDMEVPYAGHPTIGTFFVLGSDARLPLTGRKTVVNMEAKAGIMPVEIYRDARGISKVVTVQKRPEFGEVFSDIDLLAEALSVRKQDFDLRRAPPQLVSTGLPWLIAPLRRRKTVEKLSIDAAAFAKVVKMLPKDVVDVYATCLEPVDRGSTTHSRGFSLVSGYIVEDPATGSASGCLGAYLVHRKLVDVRSRTRMVNEQGYEIGRPSKVEIEVGTSAHGGIDSVRVGGTAVEVMRGTARF